MVLKDDTQINFVVYTLIKPFGRDSIINVIKALNKYFFTFLGDANLTALMQPKH